MAQTTRTAKNRSTPAALDDELIAPRPGTRAVRFSPAREAAPPVVCVIAEIGVNHDGCVERAISLVQDAKAAGADAVKLQLFDPRYLLSNQARLADYQKVGESDVFEMLGRLKLSAADMRRVRHAAREMALGFVVTPFSLENFDTLESLDVDAVKIASPDAVNHPLLTLTASLGKPMLISTGTADLEELGFAARMVRDQVAGGCLFHCVSSYPTPDDQASLGAIGAMRDHLDVAIGYSDHTNTVVTGALAVAAGACVIEKHLTYDRGAAGPDHAASFEGEQFGQYVKLIRQAQRMHGAASKHTQPAEQEVREICRQSVCAARDLHAGHVLTREDISLARPGTGVPACEFEAMVGKRLRVDVGARGMVYASDVV